ncbi:hypothetical protein [Spirabiliibacterium falconis]|uniref:hypothetical protein n=1 Tax=Spirabiliibacterium falconis TaxID=572023 RepID=UPI001AAD45D0|nr:hypothetical protein [Spirabiliibacterium falconis]MBE2894055.1 hypothetical protein [Spirabiliibacterium falconis]
MNLNGIYQSAVKLSLLFLLLMFGTMALCVALDYPLPTPLAFVVVSALYAMLTPSLLLHLPLANGELIPLPASSWGWIFGSILLLFIVFTLHLAIVLAWRFLRAKR